ncbi:MAG: hypothetical protein JO353_06035 [Phycisphaerae bacterium]|nr:hypothetical protein [Phycisphaerae bacterium]
MTEVARLIEFKCGSCGRDFSVPAAYAGRRAKCKTCGNDVTVPQLAPLEAPATPAAATPRLSPRDRRLTADHQSLKKALAACDWIKIISADGSPPTTYQIEYRVAGLQPGASPEKPNPQPVHRVEIKLTGEYPRTKPLCRMLTPVFHPNIDTSTICVGDHWTAGEHLVDLAVRIGEMLCFQEYNIKSPLDAEAAMWADLNANQLPLDHRDLHPPIHE